MMRIDITILDESWPYIKIIVNREGKVQEKTAQYDTATNQFEPLVLNALAAGMREILSKRKKA